MKYARTGMLAFGLAAVFGAKFILLDAAQVNPCTTSSGTATGPVQISSAPLTLAAEFNDLNATFVDGTNTYQTVTEVELGWFTTTAPVETTPPASTQVIPKSALTLATGTTNCYTFAARQPTNGPGPYSFGLRARGAAQGTWAGVTGPWGFNVDGPFTLARPVPQKPGNLRRK